eukprot:13915994-Ditylum_brightwellii.AAC.1
MPEEHAVTISSNTVVMVIVGVEIVGSSAPIQQSETLEGHKVIIRSNILMVTILEGHEVTNRSNVMVSATATATK